MKTSEIARAIGVHANTIRLYEEWGMLSHVPRQDNGYRIFSEIHLDQVRLIRMALGCTWIGGEIRRVAYNMIYSVAVSSWEEAFDLAEKHLSMVRTERRRAEKAATVLKA